MSWGPGCPPGNVLSCSLDGNGAGQTITPGSATVVWAGGVTALNFVTEVDGQYIVVLCSITRSNADAGGNGSYDVLVDGVVITTVMKSADQEQATLSGYARTQIAARGEHQLSVRGTAAVGNEVLTTPAQLIILGAAES